MLTVKVVLSDGKDETEYAFNIYVNEAADPPDNESQPPFIDDEDEDESDEDADKQVEEDEDE